MSTCEEKRVFDGWPQWCKWARPKRFGDLAPVLARKLKWIMKLLHISPQPGWSVASQLQRVFMNPNGNQRTSPSGCGNEDAILVVKLVVACMCMRNESILDRYSITEKLQEPKQLDMLDNDLKTSQFHLDQVYHWEKWRTSSRRDDSTTQRNISRVESWVLLIY